MLAKKPTRFMTNSQALGRELARRCDNTHEHQPLLDGWAKDAARYPPGLCRAICRGISKEKMQRACGIAAVLSIREGIHLTSIWCEVISDSSCLCILDQSERTPARGHTCLPHCAPILRPQTTKSTPLGLAIMCCSVVGRVPLCSWRCAHQPARL